MPVPQTPAEEMTLTLDREAWDCLRQCMSADRSVLEEELAWPDWMVTDVVEKLLSPNSRFIAINVQSKDGWTAFHFAAQNGHTDRKKNW